MKFFSTPKWGRTLCMLLLTMAAVQASAATKTEEFTTAAWPTGWELGGTATATDYQVEYDASNDYNYPTGRRGVYGQVASGTAKYILTPFVTGQGSLKFKRRNSSNGSIYIYKVESNGELSAQPIASNTSRPQSWATVAFDLGTDSHRLAIVLNGRMDDVTYTEGTAQVDAFKVYTNSTCTTLAKTAQQLDFGLTNAAASRTYYIKAGKELTDLFVSHTGNAVVGTVASTLAAGSVAQLTITQAQSGTTSDVVTVTAGELSWTVSVSGTVRDAGKLQFDFASAAKAWPSTWTVDEGWTYDAENGYASADAEAAVVSSRIKTESEGERIYIRHYGTVYDGGTLQYSYVKVYSSPTGDSWTLSGETSTTQSAWTTTGFDIPATAKYIKIVGRKANVNYFYGLEADDAAQFATLSFAADDYDFGLISAATTTAAYTINNTGNAPLTGLRVSVEGSTAFTVSVDGGANSIAAGASASFTVTMAAATPGLHTATIRVTSDNGGEASFQVSGAVMKSGMTTVGFDDDALPARWTQGSTEWTFAEGAAKGVMLWNVYATMTTPRLTFAQGDFLVVKAKRSGESAGSLLIEGSADGTDFTAYSREQAAGSDWQSLVFGDIPTTVKYLRLTGKYVLVDEITGLTYAPDLAVADQQGNVLSSPAAYDFGEQNADATVTYRLTNAGGGTLTISNVQVTGGDGTYTTNFTAPVAAPFDLVITQKYDATKAGDKTATVTVTSSEGTFVINLTGHVLPAAQPKMDFYLGEAVEKSTSGAAIDFGMTTGAAQAIRIDNPGTGALVITGISVPAGFSLTDGTNAVAPTAAAPLTIAAGSSKVLTLTITQQGQHSGTLTIQAQGQDDFSFSVSGYLMDASKMLANFDNNQLPEGWTLDGTAWTVADQMAHAVYSTGSKSYLVTPLLTVAAGETLAFQARSTGTYPSITIEMQKNKGDWQTCRTITSDELTTDWQVYTISGLEAGDYKLRFQNDGYDLDNVNGFTVNTNDPILSVFADAAATTVVATGVKADMGFADADKTIHYYLKNSGTGTLTVNGIDNTDTDNFTTAVSATTLAGTTGVLTLDITMRAATVGRKQATITVRTDGGTFVVNASGFVYGDRYLIDFTQADKLPAKWTAEGWTIADGAAKASDYSTGTLETYKLTVAEGETLYVEARQNGYTGTLATSYQYTENGETKWSEPASVGTLTGDYQVLEVSGIPAGQRLLRFSGQAVSIRRIYGFTQVEEAILTTDAADYDFGMQTAEASTTFTISNEGNATLTGISVAIASGTGYSATCKKTTLAAGESATVTVRQLYALNNLGAHNAQLTITADGQETVTVALSGATRDASKQYVDFADGLPEGWVGNGWSAYASSGYASASNGTLRTSAMRVAAGEQFTVDTRLTNYQGGSLAVRYTADGGVTWSDDITIAADYDYSKFTTRTFTLGNEQEAVVFLEFRGVNAAIDNLCGATATTAPMIAVAENGEAIENGGEKDFGSVSQLLGDQTATYVISNPGTASLTSTVVTTGAVSAVVTTDDTDHVTVNNNQVTIQPGASATVTVTLPFAAPYGEKTGTLTISSEDGVGQLSQHFKAVLVDPAALYVDFADNGQPAGWYSDNWTFADGYAKAGYAETELLTEQLEATAQKNVLSFEAWQTSTSQFVEKKLTVYTSADRKTWSEGQTFELTADRQQVSLATLPAGKYYVKFVGCNVAVDNLSGLNRLTTAPDHDIYVAASELPESDLVPAAELTASVKVAALRADETVKATLYFGTDAVAMTTTTIAAGTAQTITLTGHAPAEENTYNIYIKVEAGSLSETTAATAVRVEHIRTLAIQGFERSMAAGEAEVITADENNRFSAAFNVVVRNTGTVALTPTIVVKQGDDVVATATAGEALAAGEQTTLTLQAAGMSAGEGGQRLFTAEARYSSADDATAFPYASEVAIEVVASAPLFTLAEGTAALENDADLSFGIVKQATTRTLTIRNGGTRNLQLLGITAPDGFTATALTDANSTIAPGAALDIQLTLKALQGKKQGDVTFAYQIDDTHDAAFTLHVSGRSVSTDTWVETFDAGIPSDWQTTDWQTTDAAGKEGSVYSYVADGNALVTPRLTAASGETLNFDIVSGTGLTVEWSADRQQWTAINQSFAEGEQSLAAPTEGDFYLRFSGRYVYLDNFVGWQKATVDHDLQLAAADLPLTTGQYAPYTASVTVREMGIKDDRFTAILYVNGAEADRQTDVAVAKGSSATVALTCTPETTDAMEVYVEVRYGTAGVIASEKQTVAVSPALTLDEMATTAPELESGQQPAVVVRRTFVAGWNTLVLPFTVASSELTRLFGASARAFKFTGYSNGALQFTSATELTAGQPYLLHIDEAITEPIVFKDVTISSMYNEEGYCNMTWNGVTFTATFHRMTAGALTDCFGIGVAADGRAKIMRLGTEATISGYRAYFAGIPTDADAPRLVIDGQTTSIGATLTNNGIVNSEQFAPATYDLNGRRVETVKKGNVYVYKNKKIKK